MRKMTILAALAAIAFASAPCLAFAKQLRDSANYHGTCAQQVMHKHPGLKGAAFKEEYGKCLNDQQAGKDYQTD